MSWVTSACLLAMAPSVSFSALARDIREASRWFRCSLCFSAEATLGGRVDDERAASRIRARADVCKIRM